MENDPRVGEQTSTTLGPMPKRYLEIREPNGKPNTELWEITSQRPIGKRIEKMKWRWIGHILRQGKGMESARPEEARQIWDHVEEICGPRTERREQDIATS